MPYVFRHGYVRITARGFPHSEIPGSKVVQHLTGAYRSRPRPSSTPGAKASANGSYYLDRKELFCHSAVFKVRAGVPAHLEWFQGSAGGDHVDRDFTGLRCSRERGGTTDLSKLNRNEAVHVRANRAETGTSVVDVEF